MLDHEINILLGSGSPRRRQLLQALGFNFRVQKSNTDEIPKPGLKKNEIALFLAQDKAVTLMPERKPGEILLTADTIVCIDDDVLNKPEDESHAIDMLLRLNGKTHQVYTAVCLIDDEDKKSFWVQSDVTFNQMQKDQLMEYIRRYKPFDKAGSYGAQECLPEGMNPCSVAETEFLKRINLTSLFKDTLSTSEHNVIPLIKHIEGSYFNVMGLPIVELCFALTQS